MRRIILLVMVFVFSVMVNTGSCESIDWKQYGNGMRLAQKENKKVFLHFMADWCRYCTQMEQTTFKNSAVIEFLNTHFISIKVDGDKETPIVKAHKVTGYPDNRFLDQRKNEIRRLPGYVQPMMFSFFLEYIQTDSYKTMDPMQYYKSK